MNFWRVMIFERTTRKGRAVGSKENKLLSCLLVCETWENKASAGKGCSIWSTAFRRHCQASVRARRWGNIKVSWDYKEEFTDNILILENRVEELRKVGKEKNGSDWECWDENGDAVKSWTLLVMVIKNDEIYPANLRCTDSSRYFSARYSELYGTTPAARHGTCRKDSHCTR